MGKPKRPKVHRPQEGAQASIGGKNRPRVETATPTRGSAFNVQTNGDFLQNWNRQAPCPGQYEQPAFDSVWHEMLASDPVGASWDPPARRAPVTAPGPGWTQEMAKNTKIPHSCFRVSIMAK